MRAVASALMAVRSTRRPLEAEDNADCGMDRQLAHTRAESAFALWFQIKHVKQC